MPVRYESAPTAARRTPDVGGLTAAAARLQSTRSNQVFQAMRLHTRRTRGANRFQRRLLIVVDRPRGLHPVLALDLIRHQRKQTMCWGTSELGLALTLLLVSVRPRVPEAKCILGVHRHDPLAGGPVVLIHVQDGLPQQAQV